MFHNLAYGSSLTNFCWFQAKLLYGVPFTEDENESLKFLIQRDLYSYIAILLEGHEHFTEDHAAEMSRIHDEPGPSGDAQFTYATVKATFV